MDAQSRQAALDNIPAEDLAKIQAYQAKTSGAYKVDDEWLILAEFAKAYGWQAYLDVRADKISLAEMMTLIEAHRKLKYLDTFMDAKAAFIGAGSVRTKSPSKTFDSLTKDIIKRAEADS